MSYCLNPDCQKPQNPDRLERCRNCGAKLLLKERYRPIQPIGQGGFGRTFLAIDEDKPSKPRCVVKQFLPAAHGARHLKKAADLFEQEALRLEELGSHPQIPALLAHFNQDQRQYLVQEFVNGKTLTEVLQDQGVFNEAQIRDVLTSLLPVLEFVHSYGIIHRDIKPSNIILASGRQVGRGYGKSGQPDWAGMLQVLSIETAQGFRDFTGNQFQFSGFLSQSLASPPRELAISDYGRWQWLASQFASYATLSYSQRQYLVADASRLLYEMRRKYEQQGGSGATGLHLVLVDFGAAKEATPTELMKTGTNIGSPEYIAPEQARGKAVFASDLYGLGTTCIHLLTGRSPFDLFDPNHDAWIWRHYLVSPVGEPLGRILDRLLEPGLNRRYASAADVLRELESQPQPSSPIPSGNGIFAPIKLRSNPTAPGSAPPAVSAQSAAKPSAKRRSSKKNAAQNQTWQCLHRFISLGKVYALALTPTSSILASTSGTTIKLWQAQTGQPIRTLTGHLDIVYSLAVSPDGAVLFSGSADKSIRLWDLQTGQRLGTANLHTDTVLSLALSPDGKFLASGSLYDPIKLWDLSNHAEKGELHGHSGRIEALVFSPDGAVLASGSGDASIMVWDMSTGRELRVLKGHTQTIAALAFSPDGKTFASASWDGSVKLWSTQTWREKRTLTVESGRVNAIAFSPDGRTLVTGSDALKLWNPRTGKEFMTLAEHPTAISSVVFSGDSTTIASSSWDGAIRIWEM
ncbi:serine/threonine-protein kinase [Kovacikia minuta]|uniref:serine/threonine-protein kinase n=1 Tax=Kovacikia minuta TaxID=2931930 RepID=UPI001CEDF605|nr:serine/threonine-protein kinase [Kovacikia minuta]